ncbi:MAG TPA: 16S rRNA (uracil(1498)-N(3))-methyltransferase [Campylobacteraceae bacterium]|nr:16S rRNA (uracil(1498)-N(3))-methyltransferase [Campylobacteraceae bacterium]
MQFLYDPDAGAQRLSVSGENHKYLFKVRRFREGESIGVRNLRNDFLYHYRIGEIGRREAVLELTDAVELPRRGGRLHLIWCIIDTKVIERTLPMLNQTGVGRITFVYCDRSQKNFKPDLKRLEKILINSCQQCGRSDLMQIEISDRLDDLLHAYEDIAVLDFGGEKEWNEVERVLIGCEGGFSDGEREKLQNSYKIGFKTDLILKSETAALTIAAKLLI